jgi:hypothetical protein
MIGTGKSAKNSQGNLQPRLLTVDFGAPVAGIAQSNERERPSAIAFCGFAPRSQFRPDGRK